MTLGFETTTDEVIDGVDLTGKLAVVTGASTGIGVETARALAAAGATVVLGLSPLRLDPAFDGQALQSRVERTLLNSQHFIRNPLDVKRDTPTVHRALLQRLQDKQCERTLKNIVVGSSH